MQVSTPAAPARGRARNNTRLHAFADSCTRCLSRAKRPSAQWCVSRGWEFGPDRNRRLDTGGAAQSATPYGRLNFSPRSRPNCLPKVTSEGCCSMGVCAAEVPGPLWVVVEASFRPERRYWGSPPYRLDHCGRGARRATGLQFIEEFGSFPCPVPEGRCDFDTSGWP